ncbi:hypothetical protein HGH93_29945 [Chitinophaga polysaccharea]|uniref:hypothetical protein n=1 Tax=Chitinophaga polysaccharea TaxID=1293035 RepID=UPI0014554335|nr:hypothetical protein [Chitinophaga polysaccharea]NLR62352.1 hypothetical protein [Chitinophaga polysaccharea]
MKKVTAKKLNLGKIKVAALSSQSNAPQMAATGVLCVISFRVCTDNMSQGAPICSVDSCRF